MKTIPQFQRAADRTAAKNPGYGKITVREVFEAGPGMVASRFALDNGLEVIYMPDHSAPIVSFQSWFKVGTVNEDGFRSGIAHLFEHLMFKGTVRFPDREFDRLLEQAGAHNNAATWLDWTFYYENFPSGFIEMVFDLESDRMQNLVLDSSRVEPERDVVRSERRYRVDNDPDGEIEEVLFRRLFPNHPYGNPTLGTIEDINAITIPECLEFYRKFYQPSNIVLVVVGDCSFEKLAGLCLVYYGKISGAPVEPFDVMKLSPPDAGIYELALEVSSETLRVAWVTPSAGHRDSIPLEIAAEILFSNESSRVHRRLIEDLEIASDVDGSFEPMRLAGTFVVDVTLNEGRDALKAREVVFQEIGRLAVDGPTPVELDRARHHIEASFLRSMVTVGSRATQVGMWYVTNGDFKKLFSFVNEVSSVDAEAVRKAVRRHLQKNAAVSVIARPLEKEVDDDGCGGGI